MLTARDISAHQFRELRDEDALPPVLLGRLERKVPFAEYLRRPGVHQSALKHMDVSPMHYRHYTECGKGDTSAMAIGRAVHTAVFEPQLFDDQFVVFAPERRGNAWKDFKEAHAHVTILREEERSAALHISDAVRRNKHAAELLAEGHAEVSCFWKDALTGLACKARFDWLGPSGITDLKSTRHISEREFAREFAARGYHMQCGWYATGHSAATGELYSSVHIVAVQNAAPYDVVVYRIPKAVVMAGATMARSLLARVAECTKSGKWPGVAGDAVLDLELPEWANGAGSALVLEMDGDAYAY